MRLTITRELLAIAAALAALTSAAYADSGSAAYKKGQQAERKGNYDAACDYYKQAYTLTPRNPRYLSSYMQVRFSAASQHVHSGQVLRNTGALAEALAEFQRAIQIDSSSFIAQQELRRTADMMRRQERQKTTPKIESPLAKAADEVTGSVELQPLSTAAITLHITANSDVVYKTVGKLAGINVLIDPDFRPQKMTIDLADVTMREALDMIRLQSKTFWRPVLPNTILVAQDSPAKRKELEQNVMKTFYLSNITTPNDLQEAANMVRQILDITRVQLLAAQDALIVRGTPDQLVLAEKLLADYDKPRPEVIIDVAVMQVSRDRLRTMGTNVPTSASVGFLSASTSGSSSGSSGGGTWNIGSFAVSVSGGSFTMLSSDSRTKILQNPEIRALNNEKSTLRIGDRVPIATGSFQPGIVGGGGVSPLVSTQFQYLDVGVNIDITPHIHSSGEVTLKMALEISSVTGSENIGGITQPIIGQRRIEHETRVKDGEVNLLGGILQETETQSLSGYPWISKIPILKYLFAQENRDHQESEIVFAITPHIVRAQDVTESNQRVLGVGTANAIELQRKAATEVAAREGRPPAPDASSANTPAPAVAHPGVPARPTQNPKAGSK